MFRSKTLFIVGAGASNEANIPVGTELAKEIADILDLEVCRGRLQKGNDKFYANLLHSVGKKKIYEYLKAARQISDGIYLANSIDNYIDIHQHDPMISLCGKAAIVFSILRAEGKSSIYLNKMKADPRINFQKHEKTWYVRFAKILIEQVDKGNLSDLFRNITIVCFNYDRCIQHFLISAVKSLYAVPQGEAEKLVEGLKVFHPYGSVGNLFETSSANYIDFGQSTDRMDIVSVSESIKTYTEQIKEFKLLNQIQQEVSEADTIVFLGFGFHQQNMEVLTPTKTPKVKRVFGTAYGFSDSDKAVIVQQIRSVLKNSAHIGQIAFNVSKDLTCAGLFSEYRKTLATN